jgi:hypothetical protein
MSKILNNEIVLCDVGTLFERAVRHVGPIFRNDQLCWILELDDYFNGHETYFMDRMDSIHKSRLTKRKVYVLSYKR